MEYQSIMALVCTIKYINRPHTTVMGFENNDKRAWVDRTMQAEKWDVSTALSDIQSNTSAATFLASVSLTLSSLIGAWIANNSRVNLIYGDTSATTISIKYICFLTCSLLSHVGLRRERVVPARYSNDQVRVGARRY